MSTPHETVNLHYGAATMEANEAALAEAAKRMSPAALALAEQMAAERDSAIDTATAAKTEGLGPEGESAGAATAAIASNERPNPTPENRT